MVLWKNDENSTEKQNTSRLSDFVNEETYKESDKDYAGIALTHLALEPLEHTPPPKVRALLYWLL